MDTNAPRSITEPDSAASALSAGLGVNAEDVVRMLRELDDTTNQTWRGKRARWAALVRAQAAAIDVMQRAATMAEREAWIRCADRMPERWESVLLSLAGMVPLATFVWTGERWQVGVSDTQYPYIPEFWRPMPKAPNDRVQAGEASPATTG